MASEYTPNRRYPLYTDSDKPNLRDQYNGAIREIDTDMAQALQDSSSVASAIGAGFDAQHTVRMAIDAKADSSALTTETSARESADTALGTRITNETSARESADTALGTRIDNEITARQSADTALGTRITNETKYIGYLARELSGKKMVAFGDSNIAASGMFDAIKGVLGMTGINYAVNGATWQSLSTPQTSGYFITQVNNAQADDDVALVFVMGGINDFHYLPYSISSFNTAITTVLEAIKSKFPNAIIVTAFDSGSQRPNIDLLSYEQCVAKRGSGVYMSTPYRVINVPLADLCLQSGYWLNQNHYNEAGFAAVASRVVSTLFGCGNSHLSTNIFTTVNSYTSENPTPSGYYNCGSSHTCIIDPYKLIREDVITFAIDSTLASTVSGKTELSNDDVLMTVEGCYEQYNSMGIGSGYTGEIFTFYGVQYQFSIPNVHPFVVQRDRATGYQGDSSPILNIKPIYSIPLSQLNGIRWYKTLRFVTTGVA